MEKRKKYNHNDELMAILRFTPDDLETNRENHLSDFQQTWLQAKANYGKKWANISLYISLAIVILGILTTLFLEDGFAIFGILSTILFLSVPSFLIAHVFQRRITSGIKEGIKHCEGIVTLDIKSTVKNSKPYILIDDEVRLSIPRDAFALFKNGEPYEVYYVGDQIVSAYWLNASPFESDITSQNDDYTLDEITENREREQDKAK